MLLAFLFFMAWRVIEPARTAIEIIGGVLSAGIAGGVVGITVAHELIHRRSRVDRFLGGVLLASMSYLHWALEHVAGHHRLVATRADPATARLGESLPRFLVLFHRRQLPERLGHRSCAALSDSASLPARKPGSVVRAAPPLIVAAAIGLALGLGAVLFFFAQSLVAIVAPRKDRELHRALRVSSGVWSPLVPTNRAPPLHSWNASHRLTNALLFNLQRHSDHHVWPGRQYFTLATTIRARSSPSGHAGMALLAMVPPLWRRVGSARGRSPRPAGRPRRRRAPDSVRPAITPRGCQLTISQYAW